MVTRCGLVVSSLARAVCPSSAHVIALSKNKSSSSLVFAFALLAAIRWRAFLRNVRVYGFASVDCTIVCGGGVSFGDGSVAKACNVAYILLICL